MHLGYPQTLHSIIQPEVFYWQIFSRYVIFCHFFHSLFFHQHFFFNFRREKINLFGQWLENKWMRTLRLNFGWWTLIGSSSGFEEEEKLKSRVAGNPWIWKKLNKLQLFEIFYQKSLLFSVLTQWFRKMANWQKLKYVAKQ